MKSKRTLSIWMIIGTGIGAITGIITQHFEIGTIIGIGGGLGICLLIAIRNSNKHDIH
jgi:hypothetical protein